jgi:Family of unknown function (DUF6364)
MPGMRDYRAVRTSIDTAPVRTYPVYMNLTLSIEDDVVQKARRRAEAMGTSVNQLVRQYLEQLAGRSDPNADAAEFEQLSRSARGNAHGWKFNREELHQRK